VPSRKQRRRREKLQRHEWELVEVDDDGNEVAIEPAPAKKAEAKKQDAKAPRQRRRPLREVKPPSWTRSAKRSLLFVPILYIFLSIGKNAPSVPTRLGISLLYAVIFIPMFFFVDRLAYRAYKRRLGEG
jgi:hypothetical protein